MSTTLPQSQWLHKVAQGIEQACACHGEEPYPYVDAKGVRHVHCLSCGGSGVVHPYAETGVAGWLDARGAPWPRLTWRWIFEEEPDLYLAKDEADFPSFWDSAYSLHLLDAFALLEEATGGYWERTKAVATGKDIYEWFNAADKEQHKASSAGELLDKIMAEEVKHGAAD